MHPWLYALNKALTVAVPQPENKKPTNEMKKILHLLAVSPHHGTTVVASRLVSHLSES
jgi:hypothetical protein